VLAILMGPPGSGKGRQAPLLAADLGVKQLSTGEVLRVEASRGTPLGAAVAPLMEAGALVPDDLVVGIIADWLGQDDLAPGAVLDGFPRTVGQACALDAVLADQGRAIDVVISLDVPEDTLTLRILHRAEEQGRADDTPVTVRRRMAEHRDKTEPVLGHYRCAGVRVIEVDGVGAIDAVRQRIRAAAGSATVTLGRNHVL
jgi:adenylate kinase